MGKIFVPLKGFQSTLIPPENFQIFSFLTLCMRCDTVNMYSLLLIVSLNGSATRESLSSGQSASDRRLSDVIADVDSNTVQRSLSGLKFVSDR